MSYFDDASLVMIPSGYKDQKVYSVKPLDGSGDLTFSRASSATRVASNGLIEKVRTNTILYSQAFDNNAAWVAGANGTGIAPVVTANNATAPDGTMTADTIVFNSGAGTTSGDSSVVYQAITANGLYTASFYARVTSGTGQLVFRSVAGSTYTTANLTTTWQRFSAAETGSSGFFEIGIRRGLSNEPINASVTVQMWGAQLEVGDIATDYIATTSAAVSVGPVSGLPRLDYLNSTCPRLLLEPQRSNLMLQSENLNTSWTPIRAIATSNAATSPDGYANADKLIADTDTNTTHLFFQNKTSQAAGTYTYSAFFKKAEYEFGAVRIATDSDTKRFGAVVNLNTGAVTATDSFGSPTGTSTKVENYGNGWYRIIVTCAHTSGDILGVSTLSPTAVPTFSNSLPAFTGNNTSGVFTWGAQLEAGAYATSYIPTLGTSVTRVADAASKTGISSLIGQPAGSFYFEYVPNRASASTAEDYIPFTLNDGTTSNAIFFNDYNSNLTLYIQATGTESTAITFPDLVTGNTYKIAVAYNTNDVALYINGVLIGTDSNAVIPTTMSKLQLNAFTSPVHIGSINVKQVLLFKTRLSNSDLAALTA